MLSMSTTLKWSFGGNLNYARQVVYRFTVSFSTWSLPLGTAMSVAMKMNIFFITVVGLFVCVHCVRPKLPLITTIVPHNGTF